MFVKLFKSDRCGIEILIPAFSTSFFRSVQIRPLRDWNYYALVWYDNMPFVQIRPLRDWNLLDSGNYIGDEQVQIRPLRDWNMKSKLESLIDAECSNQTVAGLKLWPPRLICLLRMGSNQTVAGLKYCAPRYSRLTQVSFKSDRCGIEI